MTDTLTEAARALLEWYDLFVEGDISVTQSIDLRAHIEDIRAALSAPPGPSAEPPEGYLKIVKKERVPFVVDPDPLSSSAEQEGRQMDLRKQMVERFLSWPLPQSVCSDLCVTNPDYQFPRSGTNLLTAAEAEQMVDYLLASPPSSPPDTGSAERAREELAALRADVRRHFEAAATLTEERDALRAENARLRSALGFASSVIKSGEPWTDTCERIIGSALAHPAPKDKT